MQVNRRLFRFGVQFSRAATGDEWEKQARRAEALGYNIALMPDHLGNQFAFGPGLASIADATTNLRIGTFFLQIDLRHPTFVAMEAATLDVLSNGRFELGLGAGGSYLPGFEAAGARFADLELNVLIQQLRVTDDPASVYDELSRFWTPLTPEQVRDSPYFLIGSTNQIAETLQARRERHGISNVVVFDRDMDALAPVIAQLAGI